MNTLIANATVIDVHAGEWLPAQNVAVENGRIVAEPPQAHAPFAEVIDASGYFLCPGSIDCHVHLFLYGGADPRNDFLAADDDDRLRTAIANASLERW